MQRGLGRRGGRQTMSVLTPGPEATCRTQDSVEGPTVAHAK